MLFRRDPDMPVTPLAQIAQFLDLGMVVLDIILHREPAWVEDANVTAQTK